MNNKQQINRLKDMAELAWASYGYFDLIGKEFDKKKGYKGREDAKITMHDILDSAYKNHIAMGKDRWGQDIQIGTLKGDFSPTQAKNFFERYDLLIHQPNTDSGFSATLFQNKQTKEYILSFRGTELNNISQIWADLFATDIRHLLPSSTPKAQYDDMLNFYESCARDYPQIKEKDSLTLTGHSLGGYLAQRFCPIICYNQ